MTDPGTLDRLAEQHGQAIVKTVARPVIPTELHGYSVTVGLGPYPPDQPLSHRKAVYAELLPVSEQAVNAMRHIGRARILGIVPLIPEAATVIAADPQGALAEMAATDALREAARLAKQTTT